MKTKGRRKKQAPDYASPKLRLTHSLTGVKCRATSVAKNVEDCCRNRIAEIELWFQQVAGCSPQS